MTTLEEKRAVVEFAQGMIDAVKAGGDLGTPGGILYGPLMGRFSLDQFNDFMGGLVKGGFLRKSGQLYFYVKDLLKAA